MLRLFLKTTTLYPGGIRSHDPLLQPPRYQRQAGTIPQDHAARAMLGFFLHVWLQFKSKLAQFPPYFVATILTKYLPDGISSNQKSQFGKILEGLAMEDIGIFYGH
jgi:hypothetical protein